MSKSNELKQEPLETQSQDLETTKLTEHKSNDEPKLKVEYLTTLIKPHIRMMNGCCFGEKSEVNVAKEDGSIVSTRFSELKQGDRVEIPEKKFSIVLCLIEIIEPEKSTLV
jgi:hypothetical protein